MISGPLYIQRLLPVLPLLLLSRVTVPEEVTNNIRLVFEDGSELLYDFSVNIPAPVISSVKCEYVPDGDTLVLYGDYFFNAAGIFPRRPGGQYF